jgi:hypothetical protein
VRGFVGSVGRLVDPCFCAAAVLERTACAMSIALGRLLLRANVSVEACSGAGLLFLTMLVLWFAIEDFLVLFIESSNKPTPNKLALLKHDIWTRECCFYRASSKQQDIPASRRKNLCLLAWPVRLGIFISSDDTYLKSILLLLVYGLGKWQAEEMQVVF